MPNDEARLRRQGRVAALVIAASGLLAVFAPFLIRDAGLPDGYVVPVLLISLAGFAWAMFTTFRVWRAGRKD